MSPWSGTSFTKCEGLIQVLQVASCHKLTVVEVMAWCQQATSHYLSQSWPRSMLLSVLSNVQNRGSPNGPPMVDGSVVRITFGWSVYVVVRNDNKTLIMTSMPFVFHDHQGLYPKISLSLGRTRFLFEVLQSFWNLIGGPLLVLPSCLSHFKAIGNFQTTHSC